MRQVVYVDGCRALLRRHDGCGLLKLLSRSLMSQGTGPESVTLRSCSSTRNHSLQPSSRPPWQSRYALLIGKSALYQSRTCAVNSNSKLSDTTGLVEHSPAVSSETFDGPSKSFIQDVEIPSVSGGSIQRPFYYKPSATVNVDYNVVYTKNTFISASRALSDYLITWEDLEGMRKTQVRTAYSDSDLPPDYCYLKMDVEKRAMERWGSLEALESEKARRQKALEEGEKYRRGLSALIGHLKKTVKEQTKKEEENRIFGARAQRTLMMKGSARVVMYAVASNLLITSCKLGAYLYTGSATMLSETIHSLADAANQALLALGIYKSIKEPSPDHPYGWERTRYIYSLISGVGIFFVGCGFSVYHGISELLHPTHLGSLSIAYSVLGISFFVEGLTLAAAFKQVKKSASEAGVSFQEYVTRGRDPNAVAVLLEDSAAVSGILIASVCIGLTSVTGNSIFDAVGSISIGALLGMVAVFLIQRNSDSLIGRSIHPHRLRQILNVLENDVMVRSIHDVKATELGADTVRFKAEINFDGRELTRVHVNRLDLEAVLREVQKIKTPEQLEQFLLEHGEQIVDVLGAQVDRIERNIKKCSPEVRHVDLEIL